MAEYYFDIETYSPNEKPNPDTDKIITIQFQRIDLRTGKTNRGTQNFERMEFI